MRDFLKKNKFIVFSFFLITISYTSYGNQVGLLNIKYIGILILAYLGLREDILRSWCIPRNKGYLCLGMFFYFFIVSLIQANSVSNVFLSVFYGIILWLLVDYSGNIIKDDSNILAIGIGVFLGILFAFLTSNNAFVAMGSGRKRVYGGFMHPNTFGGAVMSVFICYFIFLTLHKTKLICKLYLIVSMVLMVYFSVLSDSKSSRYGILIFSGLSISIIIARKTGLSKIGRKLFLIMVCLGFGFGVINNADDSLYLTLFGRINSLDYLSGLSFVEMLVGQGLTGSVQNIGSGTEFAITSTILKLGISGIILYFFLFFRMSNRLNRNNEVKKRYYYILLVCFLLTCLAEAYLTNITNIYSIIMWSLLGAFSNGKSEFNDGSCTWIN